MWMDYKWFYKYFHLHRKGTLARLILPTVFQVLTALLIV